MWFSFKRTCLDWLEVERLLLAGSMFSLTFELLHMVPDLISFLYSLSVFSAPANGHEAFSRFCCFLVSRNESQSADAVMRYALCVWSDLNY